MILKFLPFALMAPFGFWIAYQLWRLRSSFAKAMGVVTIITAFVFGFLLLLNTVVLV